MISRGIKARMRAWREFMSGSKTFSETMRATSPSFLRSKKETETILFGKILRGYNNEFIPLIDEIINKNQYHIELIKEDAVVVDAGANLGIFSIFVAKTYPKATVYAFEPTPSTFEFLKKNVEEYPNIKIFNYGLGEIEKKASIVVVHYNSGENHVGKNGIPIEIKTIDGLNAEVNFIKMDTEGYEGNILRGAAETIKKYKPIIAMSAYHKPDDKEELPRIVKEICPDYICDLHKDAEEDFICYVKNK